MKPGHFIEFSIQEELSMEQIQPQNQQVYWNVYDSYNKPQLDLSFEAAKEETESILKTACDYRMVSDVPVGVFFEWGL
jgi:asparagine synthase (glutamine-hydrolysing)